MKEKYSVYVTVRLTVELEEQKVDEISNAVKEIIQECDYSFCHEKIVNTEIITMGKFFLQ